MHRVVTIGVYGFSADSFFRALTNARIDFLCDLRARRGVRGRDYAFANARRLEARLAQLRIPYAHFPELAPTKEIRALQHDADASGGIVKRQRGRLDPAFVGEYEALLDGAAAAAAIEQIREQATAPELFCVERLPSACHRSLVASRLAAGGIPIEDIVP